MMEVGLDEMLGESHKESIATHSSRASFEAPKSWSRRNRNPVRALATILSAFNPSVHICEGCAYRHPTSALGRSAAGSYGNSSPHRRGHQRAVGMQMYKETTRDLVDLRRELAETDKSIIDLNSQIESLTQERKSLQKKRNSISNIVDEMRFEVSTWSNWNAPILSTLFGAALTAVLWQDIRAISALAYYNSVMEADWFPESIKLLSRLPVDLLESYGAVAGSEDLTIQLVTKACTSAVSYFLGDLLAQGFEGRTRPRLLDLPRAARNTALGFFLHGPVLHYWILWEEGPVASLAGGNDNPSAVFLKILLDQTMFASFINLAYATLDELLLDSSLSESFEVARQVLVPSVVASWRFWPFVHLLSYSPLIPIDYKLLWIDTMEILWVAILSTTVNAGKSTDAGDAIEDRDEQKWNPWGALPWGETRYQLMKDRAEAFGDWIAGISLLEDDGVSMSKKVEKLKAAREVEQVSKTTDEGL